MLITCTKCGQEYSSESPSCPACGASHEITCHECGKQYASTSPTCPYCGANNLVIAARAPLARAVAPVNVHVVGVEWNLLQSLARHRGLLATLGAALIVISLFLPACYIPTRGSLSIIKDPGTSSTIAFGILVVAILTLSFAKRHSFQFIPAAVCFAVVAVDMYDWHSRIAAIRAIAATPSMQAYTAMEQLLGMDTQVYQTDLWKLEWGWYVLVAGGLLVLLASLLRDRSRKQDTSPVPPDGI